MEWLKELALMNEGRASRKTALQLMLWVIASLVLALGSATAAKAPTWLLICLVGMLAVVLVVTLRVYCDFAKRSPENLRSEVFVITRMQIERSSMGDNIRGEIEAASATSSPQPLPGPAQEDGR